MARSYELKKKTCRPRSKTTYQLHTPQSCSLELILLNEKFSTSCPPTDYKNGQTRHEWENAFNKNRRKLY